MKGHFGNWGPTHTTWVVTQRLEFHYVILMGGGPFILSSYSCMPKKLVKWRLKVWCAVNEKCNYLRSLTSF